MKQPIILLGSGGHARVLLDALYCNGIEPLGYVDCKKSAADIGIDYLGDDEYLEGLSCDELLLVNGVGDITRRQQLFESFKTQGFNFGQVIHPSAIISKSALLAEGVQVMAGAVIQTGVNIDENVIINTRASIDHDCSVGSHSHVAVGAVLAGDVRVSKNVLIGAGSTVIQGLTIGSDSVVAAGAVVIHDVAEGRTVIGVPAN